MKRLTELFINDYGFTKPCDDLEHLQLVADKLGQLEDIEERYGIEILTILKVMINGCYYYYNGKIEHFIPSGCDFACPNLDNKSLDLMYASCYENACHLGTSLLFEDFGKTWALTKDGFKNDK